MGDTELLALARKGIAEALSQREAETSPLAPLVLDESLYGCSLDDRRGKDPFLLAQEAIAVQLPSAERCVLLLDTLFDFGDGRPCNAIVAHACEREGEHGIVVAQRYRPKGWLRRFTPVGEPERKGTCKNFVRAAFADGTSGGASKFLEREELRLERMARDILAGYSILFTPVHEIREVSPADFAHLDLAYYDAARSSLATEGFVHLADVENETITKSPGSASFPVMMRVMCSEDGSIVATAYDLKPRTAAIAVRHPRRGRIEFDTEFDDGVILTTGGAETATQLPQLPSIRPLYLREGAAPLELLSAHRERVAAHAAATGASPLLIKDYPTFLASLQRITALKAAHRRELGVGLDELIKLSDGNHRLAREVHRKITEILARG
jgi:hypothetical protein